MKTKKGCLLLVLALPLIALSGCSQNEEVYLPTSKSLTDTTIGVGETLYLSLLPAERSDKLDEWVESYKGDYTVTAEGKYEQNSFAFSADAVDGFLVTCKASFDGVASFSSVTMAFGNKRAKFGTRISLRSDSAYQERPSFVRGYETKEDCSNASDYNKKGFWGLEASNRTFVFNSEFYGYDKSDSIILKSIVSASEETAVGALTHLETNDDADEPQLGEFAPLSGDYDLSNDGFNHYVNIPLSFTGVDGLAELRYALTFNVVVNGDAFAVHLPMHVFLS